MVKYKKLYTACLFLNLFLLPLSTYGVLVGIASYFFTETEGVVLSSDRVRVRTGNSYVDEAQIEFTYSVDDIQYVSDIVSLNSRLQLKNRTFSVEELEKYGAGKKVKVFYPAVYPSYGVLEKSVKPSTLLMFFISLLLLFAGRTFKRKLSV